jgi:hypothetical protein
MGCTATTHRVEQRFAAGSWEGIQGDIRGGHLKGITPGRLARLAELSVAQTQPQLTKRASSTETMRDASLKDPAEATLAGRRAKP